MRLVCISDTHNSHEQIVVPEGDLLIHSGDATNHGTLAEITKFNIWFGSLPHKHKVLIAGNHDWLFQLDNENAKLSVNKGVHYLQDDSVIIEGIKIYGSPWQPRFFDWAFNLNRGLELAEKWAMIPDDVNILITHGPPHGILDEVPRVWGIENTGCVDLRKRIEEIAVLGNLKIHQFGHIHCGYGVKEQFGVKFINASNCDEQYIPNQPPIVIDL